MKKLKAKQIGPWCSFCPPKTTRAIYRASGVAHNFACDKHKDDLAKSEKQSDRLTEADYQTWMKL